MKLAELLTELDQLPSPRKMDMPIMTEDGGVRVYAETVRIEEYSGRAVLVIR